MFFQTVGAFEFLELQTGDLQVSIRENATIEDLDFIKNLLKQSLDYSAYGSLSTHLSKHTGWDVIYDSLEIMRHNSILDYSEYAKLSGQDKEYFAVFWKLPDDRLDWLRNLLNGHTVTLKRA